MPPASVEAASPKIGNSSSVLKKTLVGLNTVLGLFVIDTFHLINSVAQLLDLGSGATSNISTMRPLFFVLIYVLPIFILIVIVVGITASLLTLTKYDSKRLRVLAFISVPIYVLYLWAIYIDPYFNPRMYLT